MAYRFHSLMIGFVFSIQVVVSNAVSCDLKTGVVGVNFPIEGLALETGNTNYTENTTFTQTATNGSHVTCVRYYDDSYLQTTYDADWPLSVQFQHNYTKVGFYNFELRCYNLKDWFSIKKEISVQIPITDFEFATQFNLATTGEDLTINWSMAAGSNVTFTASTTSGLTLGDVSYSPGDTVGTLTIPAGYSIGEYDIKISAVNNVSSAECNTLLKLQEAITGLNLTADNIATTIHTDITFTGEVQTGTEVIWNYTFDDTRTSASNPVGTTGPSTNSTTIQYSSIGYYVVSLTASNLISSMTVTLPIIIEIPLSDLTLTVMNVTRPSDTVTFQVSTTATDDPTAVVWDAWYGDNIIHNGQSAALTDSSPVDITYNYAEYGYYDAEILFRNNISMVTMTARIRVGVYIEGFSLTWTPAGDTNDPTKCALFNTDHTLDLSINMGSDPKFHIDWGDGTDDNDNAGNQTANWNNPQGITKMKQWTPGTYTITVRVGNLFDNFTLTKEVTIERPLPSTTIDDITYTAVTSGAATIDLRHRLGNGPVIPDVRCNITWGDGNPDTNLLWTEDGSENLVFKVQHSYSGVLPDTYAREFQNYNTSGNEVRKMTLRNLIF